MWVRIHESDPWSGTRQIGQFNKKKALQNAIVFWRESFKKYSSVLPEELLDGPRLVFVVEIRDNATGLIFSHSFGGNQPELLEKILFLMEA